MGKITDLLSERKIILLFAGILALSLVITVYALVLTEAQVVDVQVQTQLPGVDVKIYWDAACTNEVTSITVNLGQGVIDPIRLYIRNHGEGVYTLHWNSDLSVVSGKITDWWNRQYAYPDSRWDDYALNSTTLSGGSLLTTYYHIIVPADTPLATYSWTLTLYVAS